MVKKQEEVKKKDGRGRKKGQVIEREPALIVQLNKQFRVKIDKLNLILQQKGKSETTDDNEDAGWANKGFYSHNHWSYLFRKLVAILTVQKARKEEIIPMEQYLDAFVKANKDAKKMFKALDDYKSQLDKLVKQ